MIGRWGWHSRGRRFADETGSVCLQVANAVAPLVSRLGAAAMNLRRAEEGASLLWVPFTSLFEYLLVRLQWLLSPL